MFINIEKCKIISTCIYKYLNESAFRIKLKYLWMFMMLLRIYRDEELTVNVKTHPFAHGWWNTISSYTKISTHFRSGDFRQSQNFPVDWSNTIWFVIVAWGACHDLTTIFSSPYYARLGMPSSLADQFGRTTFGNHHISWSLFVHDIGRYNHFKKSCLQAERRYILFEKQNIIVSDKETKKKTHFLFG